MKRKIVLFAAMSSLLALTACNGDTPKCNSDLTLKTLYERIMESKVLNFTVNGTEIVPTGFYYESAATDKPLDNKGYSCSAKITAVLSKEDQEKHKPEKRTLTVNYETQAAPDGAVSVSIR